MSGNRVVDREQNSIDLPRLLRQTRSTSIPHKNHVISNDAQADVCTHDPLIVSSSASKHSRMSMEHKN
eukprot:scaffold291_cov332-Pavlova_lutheri.AAC.3